MRGTHRAVTMITVAVAALGPLATTVASAASAHPARIKVTTAIPVGRGPFGVAANPRTGTVYVANTRGNTVSVINGQTNAVVAT